MGLRVFLKTEKGKVLDIIADPKNLLHKLLPSQDDSRYTCLRFIDWYGDTIFNRLQMDVFLNEWNDIEKKAATQEEKELSYNIRVFAVRCQKELHMYLMFYGD